jgi:hypothetical protein
LTGPQAAIPERLWHGVSAVDPAACAADLEALRDRGLIERGGYRGWLGPHRGWGLSDLGLTLLTDWRREVGDGGRLPAKT